MEIRKCNLIVGAAGGTAGKGSKTYKVSLPSAWIRELHLDADATQLELHFDGEQIVIKKAQSLHEFASQRKGLGHEVWLLRYYDSDRLCTTICADFTDKALRVENHTTALVKTAFGKTAFPTWDDLMDFLEERCIPRARAGLREYLDELGLDEYDPFEIIKKTSGRMAEDNQWLELEVLQ